MTKSIGSFALKALVIWVTLLAASTLAALLLGLDDQGVPDDGPLSGGLAFLVVNALHSLVLAAIASRAIFGGIKLGFLLGGTLFLAQSFLLLIEAVYFAGSVGAPMTELFASGIMSLTSALFVGGVAAIFWRQPQHIGGFEVSVRKSILPVVSVAFIYMVTYFMAGYFIAWAVPEVRTYYGEGIEIDLVPLLAFQVVRGTIWGLIALAIVRSLKDGAAIAAVIVGATFSVLAAAQLLYPNSFMPWTVRLPHLIEVGVSNFVFGVVAALILQKRT